ncbi:MAG TPA: hypothetical protein VKA09_03175 [Nitrososphaeraceae archaeon]|nr:hypothetical protein [Nitrososphaeraceae archaeon]
MVRSRKPILFSYDCIVVFCSARQASVNSFNNNDRRKKITRGNPAVVDWQQFHQFLLQTLCPERSLNETFKGIDDIISLV